MANIIVLGAGLGGTAAAYEIRGDKNGCGANTPSFVAVM